MTTESHKSAALKSLLTFMTYVMPSSLFASLLEITPSFSSDYRLLALADSAVALGSFCQL